MNCKPMEIACVTRMHPADSDLEMAVLKHIMGRPVRVTSISYNDVWLIEDPFHITIQFGLSVWSGWVSGIGDSFLTPFRGDPVDETIERGVAA